MERESFFDLREFLITVLKKLKISLFFIVALTILGGMIRFVPLLKDYLTYDQSVSEAVVQQTALQETDYPYWYEARRTLFFSPDYNVYGETAVDQTCVIREAYWNCYQNKDVLEPLVDQFYEKATKIYAQNLEAQIKYQFISRSAVNELTLMDFYEWMRIRADGQFIHLTVKSPSREFSEELVDAYEKTLSGVVEALEGTYSYKITEGQVGISLPSAVDGLIPIGVSSVSENVTKPTFSFVISRSLKGCVWGLVAGIGLSLMYCFFVQCITLKITTEQDLVSYGSPVLTRIEGKRGRLHFIDRWIDYLEGNPDKSLDALKAAAFITTYICSQEGKEEIKIAVVGNKLTDEASAFIDALKHEKNVSDVLLCFDFLLEPEAIEKMNHASTVILYEQLGQSNKSDIAKEIEQIHNLGKKIAGFVLQK